MCSSDYGEEMLEVDAGRLCHSPRVKMMMGGLMVMIVMMVRKMWCYAHRYLREVSWGKI